jgi:hypothetical protein
MNTLNNKWKGVNLAMLILISASLILSTAVSVAPVFAAKQNSDKSKGDKDDKGDKDSNESKSQKTESTISCNSNAETDDNSTENTDTPCDSQPESIETETLNATSTSTAPVSIF